MLTDARQPNRAICVALVAVTTLFLLPATSAHAIPAFAREWQTSCQTCHTTFPDLNPAGEAFRRNGYRFLNTPRPDNAPEPVPLGQPANQRDFPGETWPGSLPGNFPGAFILQANAGFQQGDGSDGEQEPGGAAVAPGSGASHLAPWQLNFKDVGFGIVLGGTLGDRISFFGTMDINTTGELALDRAALTFAPLEVPLLMITVGAFPPSLSPFSIHRSVMGDTMGFTLVKLGDNNWTPEPSQLGLEVSGILANRFSYFAGVVDGQGNSITGSKDVYARLTYKFGGLAVDGSGSSGYTRAWEEDSLAIGASIYRGEARMVNPDPLSTGFQDDWFVRGSFDLDARIRDLHLMAAAFIQQNQNPLIGLTCPVGSGTDCNANGSLDGLYIQASYMIFPWLQPTIRYMGFIQTLAETDAVTGNVVQGSSVMGHRLLFGVNLLVRENISLRVMGELRKDGDVDLLHLAGITANVTAGF